MRWLQGLGPRVRLHCDGLQATLLLWEGALWVPPVEAGRFPEGAVGFHSQVDTVNLELLRNKRIRLFN